MPLRDVATYLRRDLLSFAQPSAYLQADSEKVAMIRDRYGPGFKIGIAWRSISPNAAFGVSKSTELQDWADILCASDVVFYDLQYGETAIDRDFVKTTWNVDIVHDDLVDQKADLDMFAAQIAALDLVITTSNSTAHLAGALGAEVWLILPHVPDWRWRRTGAECLWYPHVRLYRQPAPGDWPGALGRAAGDLVKRLAGA